MPFNKKIILIATVLLCSGCINTSISSVPNMPVQISMNTIAHPEHNPLNVGTYFTVDKNGYHTEKGETHSLTWGEVTGYGGVVVVCGLDGKLAAYDMCCPKCLNPNQPIVMDSYALGICPKCGEEFSTMYSYSAGTGFPTKGICPEPLKRYRVIYSNDIIYVRN